MSDATLISMTRMWPNDEFKRWVASVLQTALKVRAHYNY